MARRDNGIPQIMRLVPGAAPITGAPEWIIPGAVEYGRVLSVCAALTCSATAVDRPVALDHYDQSGNLLGRYRGAQVFTANDAGVITWADVGFEAIYDGTILHLIIGIGKIAVLSGDRLQLSGGISTDAWSAMFLSLVVDPVLIG